MKLTLQTGGTDTKVKLTNETKAANRHTNETYAKDGHTDETCSKDGHTDETHSKDDNDILRCSGHYLSIGMPSGKTCQ